MKFILKFLSTTAIDDNTYKIINKQQITILIKSNLLVKIGLFS